MSLFLRYSAINEFELLQRMVSKNVLTAPDLKTGEISLFFSALSFYIVYCPGPTLKVLLLMNLSTLSFPQTVPCEAFLCCKDALQYPGPGYATYFFTICCYGLMRARTLAGIDGPERFTCSLALGSFTAFFATSFLKTGQCYGFTYTKVFFGENLLVRDLNQGVPEVLILTMIESLLVYAVIAGFTISPARLQSPGPGLAYFEG